MSMVRVMVCGRAATDPTIRDVNGTPCASFGVIGDTTAKDESGRYESIFFWVSVWGKRGDPIAKYLKKGEKVFVQGSMTQKLYKDQQGVTKIRNEIRAQDVEFLSSGRSQMADTTDGAQPDPPQAAPVQSSDDELPF